MRRHLAAPAPLIANIRPDTGDLGPAGPDGAEDPPGEIGPLLAGFKDWVDKLLPGVPPASALGKALSYTVNQWPKLVRYLEHPEASVDNNYLENQIRPFLRGAEPGYSPKIPRR